MCNQCLLFPHNIVWKWYSILRGLLPIHVSSQNRTDATVCSKDPLAKNWSLTFISLDQNVLFERYFLVRRSCHVPSFVAKFKKPFSQYTLILISRFCMPNPPKSLGVHSMFQLVSLCFFLCL